ncbi:somatostatin receptor type 2 [Nematostella vectensis]|uniref:somatostatin receptor type 2 n=1 Tax=Nematostella vectensis TaxID=45351 RepID=UPI0020770987|nr:somatostatin receptor type 2 [Nematostella vectensis]
MDQANATNNSLPSNATLPFFCREDTVLETAIKLIAYTAVLIVSLVGNIRVILLILRSPCLRRRTINLMVVNMALSDLFLSLFAIPRTMSEIVTEIGRWHVDGPAGTALCKFVFFIHDVSTAVSIECLVLIAVDRFCAVIYPIRTATRTRYRAFLIPLTWIIACAIHSPTLVIYFLEYDQGFIYCEYRWSPIPEEHARIVRDHYIVMFCLHMVLPFFLLTFLYSGILVKLHQRGYLLRSALTHRMSARKRREHNILKMAITILIAFAVCWAPFNTFVVLDVFVLDGPNCSLRVFFFFAMFLAYMNSAVNPGIYHFFSRNFRKVSKRNGTRPRGVIAPNINHMAACCQLRLSLPRPRKTKSAGNTPKLELITAL